MFAADDSFIILTVTANLLPRPVFTFRNFCTRWLFWSFGSETQKMFTSLEICCFTTRKAIPGGGSLRTFSWFGVLPKKCDAIISFGKRSKRRKWSLRLPRRKRKKKIWAKSARSTNGLALQNIISSILMEIILTRRYAAISLSIKNTRRDRLKYFFRRCMVEWLCRCRMLKKECGRSVARRFAGGSSADG